MSIFHLRAQLQQVDTYQHRLETSCWHLNHAHKQLSRRYKRQPWPGMWIAGAIGFALQKANYEIIGHRHIYNFLIKQAIKYFSL